MSRTSCAGVEGTTRATRSLVHHLLCLVSIACVRLRERWHRARFGGGAAQRVLHPVLTSVGERESDSHADAHADGHADWERYPDRVPVLTRRSVSHRGRVSETPARKALARCYAMKRRSRSRRSCARRHSSISRVRESSVFVSERLRGLEPVDAARVVFTFVRDEVRHSWDIQGHRVTRSASDALQFREGICYPKSHLVAALLRRYGIPTAICYQRLTLLDDDSKGYAIHALNAIYVEGAWHRIDARGNKPGVNAEFDLSRERLAFPIRSEYDEIDYPDLYVEPHYAIVATLRSHNDAIEMYLEGLPDRLAPPMAP